jgi:hypothetical protein
MRAPHAGLAGLVSAAALALGGAAYAEEMKFSANLTGAEEVPPVETGATGTADATYDSATMAFTYSVTFDGLSGPATAAHFHGPAAPGENAGPVVPIEDLESPSEGTATLTQEQADQLTGGQWYVNVHTEANPDGEIRGQVAGM